MECPHCNAVLDDSAERCSSCGLDLHGSSARGAGSSAVTFGSHAEGTAPENVEALFRPGATVARRYEVIEKIGRGGMGAVYKAHDRDLDETVALKVIHPHLISSDETIVDRFKHEIRVARRLAHPNILKVYDLGSIGDVLYLSMEYLQGIDLKTQLAEHGALAVDDGIDVACQVCAGLALAHASGVIHRDIKPHNLFLVDPASRFGSAVLDADVAGARWLVKILDFGLAKAIDSTQLSLSGQVLGTPVYLSPEQANPKPGLVLDHRTDLYSLGIVLFQMFTGKVPFQGPTALETALLHVTQPPPRPGELRPDLPPHVEAVILKALAKNRDDRYADARQIASDLRGETRFFEGPTPLATAAESRVRRGDGASATGAAPAAGAAHSLQHVSTSLGKSGAGSDAATAGAGRWRSSRWSWIVALAALGIGGAGLGWQVFLRPALIRMGYGTMLPGAPVGLPLDAARAQARKNLTALGAALDHHFSGGTFSYTDGQGTCPGSKTYGDDGTRVPDLELSIEGGDYWYTITVADGDGDGLCEKYELSASGVRPPASQDPPLTLSSDGTKSGPWE